MADTPRAVLEYLAALVIETRSPAYIVVDDQGRIVSWGGDTAAYRLPSLAEGEPVGLAVAAVEGMIPHDGPPVCLPAVEVNSGQFVDVHVFEEAGQTWVLLTDATLETMQQALIQQRLNEVNLIRSWHTRAADGRISRSEAGLVVDELPAFSEEGERLEVAVAHVRFDWSVAGPVELATDELEPLGRILRAVAAAVTHESGFVAAVSQDSLVGIFGVLPAGTTAPVHAIRAARAGVAALRGTGSLSASGITARAGIASGFVSAGVVRVAGGAQFVAIGPCVGDAAQLAARAPARCLLVDAATRAGAGDEIGSFEADGEDFALSLT